MTGRGRLDRVVAGQTWTKHEIGFQSPQLDVLAIYRLRNR